MRRFKIVLIILVFSFFIGCRPYIEQDVRLDKYSANCGKRWDVTTFVWGYNNHKKFIQWCAVESVKEELIENVKARHMYRAVKELNIIKNCQDQ